MSAASLTASQIPRGRDKVASGHRDYIRAGSRTAERLMSGGFLFHPHHGVDGSKVGARRGHAHARTEGDDTDERQRGLADGALSSVGHTAPAVGHTTGHAASSVGHAAGHAAAGAGHTAGSATGSAGHGVSTTFAASRNFFASLVSSSGTSSSGGAEKPAHAGRVTVVPASATKAAGSGGLRTTPVVVAARQGSVAALALAAASTAPTDTTAGTALVTGGGGATAVVRTTGLRRVSLEIADDDNGHGNSSSSSSAAAGAGGGGAGLQHVSTSAAASALLAAAATSPSNNAGGHHPVLLLKPVPPAGRKKATTTTTATSTDAGNAANAAADMAVTAASPLDHPRPARGDNMQQQQEYQCQCHQEQGQGQDQEEGIGHGHAQDAATSPSRLHDKHHGHTGDGDYEPMIGVSSSSSSSPVPSSTAASTALATSPVLYSPAEVKPSLLLSSSSSEPGAEAGTATTTAPVQPPPQPQPPLSSGGGSSAVKEGEDAWSPATATTTAVPSTSNAAAATTMSSASDKEHHHHHQQAPSAFSYDAPAPSQNQNQNQNQRAIDVRTYIPRSGSTGLRFSDALKAEMAALNAVATAEEEKDKEKEKARPPIAMMLSPASPSPGSAASPARKSLLVAGGEGSPSRTATGGIANPLAPGAIAIAAATTPIPNNNAKKLSSRRTILIQPAASSAASSTTEGPDAATAGGGGGYTIRSLVNARAAAASVNASSSSSSINIVASSRALLIQPSPGPMVASPTSLSSASSMRDEAFGSGSGSASKSNKPAPRAPVGAPQLAAAPIGDLTPAQRKERAKRIRLENSRCEKWREMLCRWNEWAGPQKPVGIFSGLAAVTPAEIAAFLAAAANSSEEGTLLTNLVSAPFSAFSSLSSSLPSLSLPSILGGSGGGGNAPPSPASQSPALAAAGASAGPTAGSSSYSSSSSSSDAAAAAAARARFDVIKRRCRKGIPDALRAQAWMALLKADEAMKREPQLYQQLLALPVLLSQPAGEGGGASGATAAEEEASGGAMSPSSAARTSSRDLPQQEGHQLTSNATVAIIDQVERDINRTFPNLDIFSEVGGLGQTALFRILVAYAQLDAKVGYCQGMAFVAAVFLSFMPEEAAFYAFKCAMLEPPHHLASIFAPGLPKVALIEHVLQGLINTRLPALASQLHGFGIHPTMFAAQWILTVYTVSLPFPIVVRIWDCFLCEGWKVVFRVALSALQHCQQDFLKCTSFEDIMMTFRELPQKLEADSLIEAAYAFSLTSKELLALETEYYAITTAGFDHSSSAAGFGLAAHVKLKAAQDAERELRRKGSGRR